jgi:flavin-dependent dehydrogenase
MTELPPVAVVGGGIASAAAVITLVRSGLSPVWLTPEPSLTDRVGESLAPAANAILTELGVADLLGAGPHRRSNATFSAWGGPTLVERNAIAQLDGAGWVLDRADFERALVARASALAAPRRARLETAHQVDGRWTLELDTGERAQAEFVLDGTGRNGVIGRRRSTLVRADRLVAAYAFLDQVDAGVEPTRATIIEAVEDGWWYAALLPDGRQVVAWFTDPDLVPADLTRNGDLWRAKAAQPVHIRRWIDDAGFDLASPPRLTSAGTTWLAPCAGAGWAAIGDAAAAFDPLSSHGMTTALWSGQAAAKAVVQERDGQAGALDAYALAVAGGVRDFLAQRARFYGAERRFKEAPFWSRRQSADLALSP